MYSTKNLIVSITVYFEIYFNAISFMGTTIWLTTNSDRTNAHSEIRLYIF